MRKKSYRPYVFLGLFLLTLFYLPGAFIQGMRSGSTFLSKGFWRQGSLVSTSSSNKKEEALKIENLLLKRQNEALQRRLVSEEGVDHLLQKLGGLISLDEKKTSPFFKRRIEATKKLLELELFSLPAEVICRDPSEWNSTFWINVGEKENLALDKKVVAIGSPVLKGAYLIGMVEEVQKGKSRVRLLTDTSLIPSVRVARAEEEKYLAKGELMGTASPLWRGRSEVLKGIGFNYDFGDEEGPPLELRTGHPIDQIGKERYTPLINVGDLLVTTGMDGVFPKDLPVAYVSKVYPLKEGSPSFDIEAKLCAGNLNDVLDVTVLPPLMVQDF